MSENQKTLAFALEQYRLARNWRDWKRRLAAFGFGVEKADNVTVITALPERNVVCTLPDLATA